MSEFDESIDVSLSTLIRFCNEGSNGVATIPIVIGLCEVERKAVEALLNTSVKTTVVESERAEIDNVNEGPTVLEEQTSKEKQSREEVSKMDEIAQELESLKSELESTKTELSDQLSEVEELKNALIAKDKELSDMKEELGNVTEAKETAEAELAEIARVKRDSEINLNVIDKEIELGFTTEEDREARLEALRTLSDDSLKVYTDLLEFKVEKKDAETAHRETVENSQEPTNNGNEEIEEAKKQLEKLFNLSE